MSDVLLSFASEDIDTANRLTLLLEQHGISTWRHRVDAEDRGEDAEELLTALQESVLVIVLLTRHAINRQVRRVADAASASHRLIVFETEGAAHEIPLSGALTRRPIANAEAVLSGWLDTDTKGRAAAERLCAMLKEMARAMATHAAPGRPAPAAPPVTTGRPATTPERAEPRVLSSPKPPVLPAAPAPLPVQAQTGDTIIAPPAAPAGQPAAADGEPLLRLGRRAQGSAPTLPPPPPPLDDDRDARPLRATVAAPRRGALNPMLSTATMTTLAGAVHARASLRRAQTPAAPSPSREASVGGILLDDAPDTPRSAAHDASHPLEDREPSTSAPSPTLTRNMAANPPRRAPAPSPFPEPAASAPAKSRGASPLPAILGALVLIGGTLALLIGTAAGRDILTRMEDTARSLLAVLGLKLGAFSFFGLLSGGGTRPPEPAPQTDLVDCSVFAPPAAPPGGTVLVQVFLHVPAQAERAQFMATVMDAATGLKGNQSLQTPIARGSRVTVALSVNGLDIDEPQQTIIWRGEPVFAQFVVTLPAGCEGRAFHPVARISVDGGLVGRIAFSLQATAAATPATIPVGDSARRYRLAFISYASADRKEVLKRTQVLRAAGIEVFQDVLSLEPGQRWEKEIYRHIDDCDLFLLFWSNAAKNSQWVIKEAEYALARQQTGDAPDIVPVILEGPPPVLPPDSLAQLHFNDKIQYLIAAT